MDLRRSLVLGLCLSLPVSVFADFQYSETTQITGGSMVAMMKWAGKLSKQARETTEPVTSTVLVKGNRMAHVNKDFTEVIDLDKETITRIDHLNRQYSVVTFQQMKEQMEQAAREARQKQAERGNQTQQPSAPPPDMTFKVNVRNTGAAKQVTGLDTKESILSMALEGKDKQSGQTGALAITNDMWMAPEIHGYSEVREFQRRMALTMGMMFSGALSPSLAAMQPGTSQGMAEMAKEMSKLKGTPVLQIMRMGTTANGAPLPAASEAPLPPEPSGPATPTAGDVAEKGTTSVVASKLGGLGGIAAGLGGFGRKKKQEKTEEQPQPAKPGQPAASVLMESNTQITSFSSAPIDTARFDVPAGYQQIQPPDVRRPAR